jgi:NADPH:quinone reductase-like Zn-dependent oxidoreductase
LQEKRAEVRDHPVPKLDKNDILVKVAYVAQNPTGTFSHPLEEKLADDR